MNCQRFENVVSELARGQMMEAEVRAEALAHSDACERCLVRLRDESTLTRGLQLLAAEMESVSAPVEMEAKLRQAFRSRRVVQPMPAKRAARRAASGRYWLVAIAAMLLVAMSAVAMWWRSETPQKTIAEITSPPQQQKEVNVNPSEEPPKVSEYRADNIVPKRQSPKPVHRSTATRRPQSTQLANHVTNEIATDFMPLGYMNPATLQDGGQIIRVKLPRSALATFGFPVNMDRYNENVKADVLIGVDGLARAIRFVQ